MSDPLNGELLNLSVGERQTADSVSPGDDVSDQLGLDLTRSEENFAAAILQKELDSKMNPPPGIMMTDSVADGLDRIALGDSMVDLTLSTETTQEVDSPVDQVVGDGILEAGSEATEAQGDISKYFTSDISDDSPAKSASDFFDNLQAEVEADVTEQATEAVEHEQAADSPSDGGDAAAQAGGAVDDKAAGDKKAGDAGTPAADPSQKTQTTEPAKDTSFMRVRTVSQSEEVTVTFEEVKGEGRPPQVSASMENVRKFFTEDVSGNDVEGKDFFDTFTEGRIDEEVVEQSVTAPVAVATDDSGIPSQMSPLVSPTHLANPLSSLSPMPSPAHSILPDSAGSSVQDDPFSISMKMNDTDRCHDAWLPSEATRQVLVAMVTSQPGTYFPPTSQLTMPGIIIEESLGDPVKDLVKRFMGEQEALKRKTLTAESVPQNEEGLRQLIKAECWRSAVDLTGILLTEQGQGPDKLNVVSKHSTYSIQLWFTRIALLMKLRLYSHAESECQAFGNMDRPDMYYEFYPDTYPGRKGSMVPFGFRILHAELPQFLGKSQESLDRLYYLHAVTTKILSNMESGLAEDGSMLQLSNSSRKASQEVWETRERRLLYCIGNCLLHIKDFNTAATVFESLLKKDEQNKAALLSGIGRIHLQMGDNITAESYFNQAEQAWDSNNTQAQVHCLINKGFIALGSNSYEEAREHFKEAVTKDPSNAVAVNNMAVCCLYMGRLKEALRILEELVHRDPERYLQEGVLFNLCTLYELESSRSINKKQGLLELVHRHKGNGFHVACLKMTS